MHHTIELGGQEFWKFADKIVQFHYKVLTSLCRKIYNDIDEKSKYFILQNDDTYTALTNKVVSIANKKLLEILSNDVLAHTLCTILSYLMQVEISIEVKPAFIILRKGCSTEGVNIELNDFERAVITDIFDEDASKDEVISCPISFDELKIPLDMKPFSDEEKRDIDEAIVNLLEIYNEDLDKKILVARSDWDKRKELAEVKIKNSEEAIRNLQREIERSKKYITEHEEKLNKTVKVLRTDAIGETKVKLKADLDKFITKLHHPKCPICVSRIEPDKMIAMDCKHPACVNCYKKRYELPKEGGMLPAGIIMKCIGCETALYQEFFWHIFEGDESSLMFYIRESVKYKHLSTAALRDIHICICSQCHTSYIVQKTCGDTVTQTRCDACIAKDPDIKITYCSNEKCTIPLARYDGCNVVRCNCGTFTCFNCGERLGTANGHDDDHYKANGTHTNIYFDDTCCMGRGYTSDEPSLVDKDGKVQGKKVARIFVRI